MATKLKAKKPAEVEPGHVKGVLYGKAGAGKTWFALNFPKPYYIDTEGGARLGHYMKKLDQSGGAYMGPEEGSLELDTIIDQIKILATEKHPYKTLVIDSITKAFQTAIAREAERLGDKDAFGASKKPAVSQMRRLISWIMRLDMNVWFIAHEVSEWGGTGNDRKEIGKMPDVWDKVVYELDLALRLEHPHKGLRTATVGKTRLLGFPEFDRLLLQEGDVDRGYAEFAARYGKDFIEAESKPITLATKEDVVEIDRLLSIMKIDQADIDKVLSKAGADTFADLTTEQAAKTIDWLNAKLTKGEKKDA